MKIFMTDRHVFEQICQLARPYLNTRRNDVHIDMSLKLARELLNSEGGQESIVIPAGILHDVGWKKVPEALHLKGFEIDNQRFEETVTEGLNRLRKYLSHWFFTNTEYRIAKDELRKREKEAGR